MRARAKLVRCYMNFIFLFLFWEEGEKMYIARSLGETMASLVIPPYRVFITPVALT